ncbi:MAG: S-layer protein [Candidatus Aenigmatarchaeota archaeon]
MAGLSLAAPVLATSVTKLGDISKLVGATDSAVSYPMFVIGANAATSDVAGAIDVAVNLASNAVVTKQVAVSGGSVSISSGVSMATSTNPLTMWNNFASSKQVLTATDLPDILASGNYVDAGSVSSPYSQYLTFTNAAAAGQIVYDTPNGGTSPALGLKFTGSNAVYNYQLAFTKQISETVASSSVANLINTQLSMLGKTWTITAAGVSAMGDLALTLLSGKNSQTVTTETPSTYSVGSNAYTVNLVAVGTIGLNDAATITVSGGNLAAPETLQILSGGTKSLSDGTLVGVTSIFKTTKTGAIDSATVFIGADKLELEDNAMGSGNYYAGVKINGQSLTDVTVSMTGNTTSTSGTLTLNSIAVKWTPSLEQFVSAGNSISDPFTNGAWKIFFGGITPALDDATSREAITVTPSGTSASVAFKDAAGNALTQNFVQSSAAGTGNIALKDAGGYAIHVLEGETVAQNEYVVLGQNTLAGNAQNPFGHVIRVLSLQTASTSTSSFQDMASGTTLQVTGGNTTLYLDGQAYKVCVQSTSAVQFTWGASAGYCDKGSAYDVFPAVQTSKGAWVALTKNQTVSGLTNNTAYTIELPTGTLNLVSGTVTGNASAAYTVGSAKYYLYNTAAGTSFTIAATDNAASPAAFATPGVLVVEGLDEAQARNVIAVKMDADATYNRVDIAAAPAFTSTKTSTAGVSGTTQSKYIDQFGTYVMYDSTMPGTLSISYPASQAQAIVGVGKAPAASVGGAAGTVTTQTVFPITTDVVKLDSEVTSADQSANDMVLVGGPCINTMVAQLATAGKFPYTCDTWPGRNFGRVQVIADAFATGKTALVIAGTTAADTDLASLIVQKGFSGATDAQKAGTAVEITGTTQSPAYS